MMELDIELLNRVKDEVAIDLCGVPNYEELIRRYSLNSRLVPVNVLDEVILRYNRVVNYNNLSTQETA